MEVVSRQRILSRSRDDLVANDYEDEDVWYDLDELVKEHIHEILKKWDQIDDGIWAKAIVFEKNRRVAKAYVRPPILTVNGSDVGFDGHRIGLRGFDNPMRDAKTVEVITRYVGPGVKIRMDNNGNIEVKKLSQYNVYAKPLGEENAISDEICKNPNMTLDSDKQVVFDIRKFEQNVTREVRKAYPNIAKLENQCIMALAFSKPGSILHCPSWVMIINIVAMEMLRRRLPVGLYVKVPNIKNRPRLPVPEEDPYSLTGAGSGTSSGGSSGKEKSGKDKPPKLPPRDNPTSNKSSSKGDYDSPEESVFRRFQIRKNNNNNSNSKEKDRKYDDPYYCGLRARIPNFAKQSKGKEKMDQYRSPYHPHPQMGNSSIFHSRSVDSGMAYMQQSNAPYIYKFDRNPCSMMPPQPVGYATDWENYWVS